MRCSELEKALKQMDKRYVKAFVWAFALINLAFLFHSINFMFGDHDWNYVRGATYWNEGAFEGRPLHFVLQSLFFGGQILPFLNNFLAFAAMALSGILLAKYWKLPLSVADYALFAAFPAVLPYTLVWLYYAKDTLINLSLPLLSIAALLCAAVAVEQKKPWLHLPAVLLMFFAIASYAAVINLFGVCLIGAFKFKESKLRNFKQSMLVFIFCAKGKWRVDLFGRIFVIGCCSYSDDVGFIERDPEYWFFFQYRAGTGNHPSPKLS